MPASKKTTRSRASRSASRQDGGGKDAIELLTADHDAVKALFKKYDKLCKQDAGEEEKESLAAQICSELTIHAQIEEEIFYPALREQLDDVALLDEADVEHGSAKDLIAQIRESGAGEDHYDAKVTVLGEYIKHHVAEEQGEMFKQARRTKQLDLKSLGQELAARKEELKAELGPNDERSSNRRSDRARGGNGREYPRQRA